MSFTLTVLGSSSALPTSSRNLTAHLVTLDERLFLIDCGEGTQMQLRKYKKKFHRINHIFISHLHGDHVFGLFGLLSSFSMLGRKTPLNIYAHPQLDEILKIHFNFFNSELGFIINFHPIQFKKIQQILSDKKLDVYSFPLKHRIPCAGFLFKEKAKLSNIKKEKIHFYNLSIKDIILIKNGADYITEQGKLIPNKEIVTPSTKPLSFAFCTDTKINISNTKFLEGVDLIYHESTFLEKDKKIAKATYHSTALQAAQFAKNINAKALLLGHFSSRYKNIEDFALEAKTIFPNCQIAEDGLEIEIK